MHGESTFMPSQWQRTVALVHGESCAGSSQQALHKGEGTVSPPVFFLITRRATPGLDTSPCRCAAEERTGGETWGWSDVSLTVLPGTPVASVLGPSGTAIAARLQVLRGHRVSPDGFSAAGLGRLCTTAVPRPDKQAETGESVLKPPLYHRGHHG